MTTRALLLAAAISLFGCGSKEQLEQPKDERSAAAAAVHRHIRNTFGGDQEKIAAGYAPTVRLAEGHRFLLPEYGLVDAGTSGSIDVDRDRYAAAIVEFLNRGDPPSKEELDKFFASALFKAAPAETEDGVRSVDLDSRSFGGGKLEFPAKRGDIFVRFFSRPESRDFVIYQMRKYDERWLVVGEFSE